MNAKTIAIAFILSFCFGSIAFAESANTYRDAVSQCGKEWRASDARKAVAKGEGRNAWQAFRKDCVARVGYTKKARNSRS